MIRALRAFVAIDQTQLNRSTQGLELPKVLPSYQGTNMIPPKAVLRIARPTDRLQEIARMYAEGLGFERLSEFSGHEGFDGVILGHPRHPWHLEFTQHHGTLAGRAPTRDNLLVFYVPEAETWSACCASMRAAGFIEMPAFNAYWDQRGKTFEDLDGYRVVIENDSWRK